MVHFFKFFLVFSIFICYAQNDGEVYSVYFKTSQAKGYSKSTLPQKYFRTYQLKTTDENILRSAAGDKLIVDESGIYIEKNKLLSISRTEIRENSKYMVRNGYLFGVLPNDSTLVALEGENYFFLFPSRAYLFEQNVKSNILYGGEQRGEYLVLSEEDNGYYSALYIRFTVNGVDLMDLSLSSDQYDLRTVEKQSTTTDKSGKTYIIDPNLNEWKEIIKSFSIYDSYENL